MSSLKTLYRSAGHYLAGSLGVMLLGFISFPIFTRAISVDGYGELNFALRIVYLTVILAKVGLSHAMVRYYGDDGSSDDRGKLQRFYTTFLLTETAAAGLVTVVYLVIVLALPAGMVSPLRRYLLLVGSAFLFANAVTSLLTGTLRAMGRSKAFAGVQTVVKAISILTSCALIFWWEKTPRSLITSNVLSELITLGVLLVWFNRDGFIAPSRFDSKYARTILAFGFPLILFEIASSVLDTGDRLLIPLYLDDRALGLYSAAYNVSAYVQDLLFSSLNLAMIPIYLTIWKEKGRKDTEVFLSTSLSDFVLGCCLLCCGAAVCGGDALILLASQKYTEAAPLVPYLVVGLVIYTLATFFNAGLYLNKRTGVMAGIVAASAVVNLALNVLLLPRMGLMAAVWATLLSFVFLVVVTAMASRKYLHVDIDWRSAAGGVSAAVITAAVLSPIDLHRPVFNLLAKGTLSVIVYTLLVFLFSRHARSRILPHLQRSAAA